MQHIIVVKRQSEGWATGDDRLVKEIPLYCGDELIEDMESWAMIVATEAVCRDLSRQLIELFRQSPRNYHITGGHFKVSEETCDIFRRKVVDLTLIISDEDDD